MWFCVSGGGSAISTEGTVAATDCEFTRCHVHANGCARFIETLGPAGYVGLVAFGAVISVVGTQVRSML